MRCTSWKAIYNQFMMRLTFLGLFFVTGCASRAAVHKIAIDQEAVITQQGERPITLKSGSELAVTEPTFIESPGHIGVLVIPGGGRPADVNVRLRPISTWAGDALDEKSDKILSDVVERVIEVQHTLARKDSRSGLVQINSLLRDYPRLAYLQFLRASCLLLTGDKPGAISALEIALKRFPGHSAGNNLYRTLVGHDYKASKQP